MKIQKWYFGLSNRTKKSFIISSAFIGAISTVMTIMGLSINDLVQNISISFGIVFVVFLIVFGVVYLAIGFIYSDSISMFIGQTPITICYGDLFQTDGIKVIGCDNHFETKADDIVISKKSLHGKLLEEHGDIHEITEAVNEEANRQGLQKNKDKYDFSLGTIVPYKSSVDKQTYLLLALSKLDDEYKAHTNMAEYENMLMKMWNEIDRVYARNKVVLPLLGTGILRFDDGPKSRGAILRCMLCTLKASGVTLKSEVKIVLHKKTDDILLYEYKNML